MRSLLPVIFASLIFAAPGDTPTKRQAEQTALKPYGGLVGEWKGTGQTKRGSASGSWVEKGAWAWKLTPESAALELSVDKGKFLKAATLAPGTEANTFRMEATLPDGKKRTFSGKSAARNVLTLIAEGPAEEGVARITLTPLHDTRLLVLMESRDASGDYGRLGEVGYTRQGVAFAAGDSSPICIVTEGRGTIPIKYKGQTYYVCCSGCKDLFDENPEAILAEAAQKAKAKAK